MVNGVRIIISTIARKTLPLFEMGRRGRGRHSNQHQKSNHHKFQHTVPFKHKSHVKRFSHPSQRLQEPNVGIEGYVGEHDGVSGVIKSRVSDFHVNEISVDGNIVRLTNTSIPETAKFAEVNTDILPDEMWNKLEQLKNGSEKTVIIEVTNRTKEERKTIHEAIRCKYQGCLRSHTEDSGNTKLVTVYRTHDKDAKKYDRRVVWPTEWNGPYVHFVLYKENMDTMSAVNLIASKLRLKPNSVKFCGTKDKRAKTSQMLSVYKIPPSRLETLGNGLRSIEFGNYTFNTEPCKLGHLKGNMFRIALRNVTASEDNIKTALLSLQENGFINFYGLQRFGTFVDVPTYEIGKQLLLRNWEKAIDLILCQRTIESHADMKAAKRVWAERRNAKEAFGQLRESNNSVEGKLLKGLTQCAKNDYMNALDNIPLSMRTLYTHSYQSLIWNKVVSHRIMKYGSEPKVGDLVWEQAQDLEEMTEDVIMEDLDSEANESSLGKQNIDTPMVLTEDTVKSARIEDVVLPLPGHDIIYPEGEVGSLYNELLEKDGISPEVLQRRNEKYSLRGTYRRLIVKPSNLTWKVMRYKTPEDTLILSDIEELKGVQLPNVSDGDLTALVLSFILPPSSYATMALREITKQDTSASFQATIHRATEGNPDKSSETECMEVTEGNGEENNVDTTTSDSCIQSAETNT